MGKKNQIGDLRDHLFEVIEALKDKDEPMEVARALAVATVASTVIDSAKVEVAFMKETGALAGSGFIPEVPAQKVLGPGTPGSDRTRSRE